MAKNLCETDGCGEEISEGCGSHGGLPICKKCRAVQYYWKKQGPKAFEHRREVLTFWTGRLDYLSTHVGKLVKQAKQRVIAARNGASNQLHH
jgi:hypothetical protein